MESCEENQSKQIQSLTEQLDRYKKHAEHYKSKCSDYQVQTTALEQQIKVFAGQNAHLTEKFKSLLAKRSKETHENVAEGCDEEKVRALTKQLDQYKKHTDHYKCRCSDYQEQITALELQNKAITGQNTRLTEKYKRVVKRSEKTNENVRKVLTSVFQTQGLLKDAKAKLDQLSVNHVVPNSIVPIVWNDKLGCHEVHSVSGLHLLHPTSSWQIGMGTGGVTFGKVTRVDSAAVAANTSLARHLPVGTPIHWVTIDILPQTAKAKLAVDTRDNAHKSRSLQNGQTVDVVWNETLRVFVVQTDTPGEVYFAHPTSVPDLLNKSGNDSSGVTATVEFVDLFMRIPPFGTSFYWVKCSPQEEAITPDVCSTSQVTTSEDDVVHKENTVEILPNEAPVTADVCVMSPVEDTVNECDGMISANVESRIEFFNSLTRRETHLRTTSQEVVKETDQACEKESCEVNSTTEKVSVLMECFEKAVRSVLSQTAAFDQASKVELFIRFPLKDDFSLVKVGIENGGDQHLEVVDSIPHERRLGEVLELMEFMAHSNNQFQREMADFLKSVPL